MKYKIQINGKIIDNYNLIKLHFINNNKNKWQLKWQWINY